MELRNEVEVLENQCKEVILSRCQRQTSSLSGDQDEQRRYDHLLKLYTQLAITQDGLCHENEELRSEAMQQLKVRTSIGILLNEELQDHAQASCKGEALGLSPWTLDAPRVDATTGSKDTNQDSTLR